MDGAAHRRAGRSTSRDTPVATMLDALDDATLVGKAPTVSQA